MNFEDNNQDSFRVVYFETQIILASTNNQQLHKNADAIYCMLDPSSNQAVAVCKYTAQMGNNNRCDQDGENCSPPSSTISKGDE